jgi:tetratricopeptide (TPR) repeat protein
MSGDHSRAATLLAALSQSQPQQVDLAQKAFTEALGAGQTDLALSVAAKTPATKLSTEARLLLVADAVKRRRVDRALGWLHVGAENPNLSFLAPLLTAWDYADRGNGEQALATIRQIANNSPLGPLRAEQEALILLKLRRTAEAESPARRAVGSAGARETRLRLAMADSFLAAGDRDRALIMIDGLGTDAGPARRRVLAGKPSGQAIDSGAKALSEALTAFAGDLARSQRAAPPIGLAQVARFANPQNSSATTLLALLLNAQGRPEQALALLRTIPRDDALSGQIRDVQVRILVDNNRLNEAYAAAFEATRGADARAGDWSRLGEVFQEMKRYSEAAVMYGRAIAQARAEGQTAQLWPLLLLQADALEQSGHWPEAKQALQQALALSPDQPLLLNFLGYGQLERGERAGAGQCFDYGFARLGAIQAR